MARKKKTGKKPSMGRPKAISGRDVKQIEQVIYTLQTEADGDYNIGAAAIHRRWKCQNKPSPIS